MVQLLKTVHSLGQSQNLIQDCVLLSGQCHVNGAISMTVAQSGLAALTVQCSNTTNLSARIFCVTTNIHQQVTTTTTHRYSIRHQPAWVDCRERKLVQIKGMTSLRQSTETKTNYMDLCQAGHEPNPRSQTLLCPYL